MPPPTRGRASSSAFDILDTDTSQHPVSSRWNHEANRDTGRHSSGRHRHQHYDHDHDAYDDLQRTVHSTRRPRPDVTGYGDARHAPYSRPLAARHDSRRHRGAPDGSDEGLEAELPAELRGPAREVARSVKAMVRRVMSNVDEEEEEEGFDVPEAPPYEGPSGRRHHHETSCSRAPFRSESAGSWGSGGRVYDPAAVSGSVGVSTRLAQVRAVSPAPPTRFGPSGHLATRASASTHQHHHRRVVPGDEFSPIGSDGDGDGEHYNPRQVRRADPAPAAVEHPNTSASAADRSGNSRESTYALLEEITRHEGQGHRAGRSASADGAATRAATRPVAAREGHRRPAAERGVDTPNTSGADVPRRASEPAAQVPPSTVPAADFARLEGEAAAVNREADRLRAQLEERDGEAASLRTSLAEAREEVFRAKHEAQIAKSEHADALTALQVESSKEKQRLLDEVLQAKREAADSSVRVRDLLGQQDRCAAAEADLERAQLQLENEQLSRKETSRELDAALAESKRRAGEIEVCRSELAVARDQLRALEAEANGLREQLHSARDETGDRVREMADERDTVRRDAESIVATAQEHIAAANAKLKEKKQALRDLRDALDRERADAAAAAESYEAECERLERRASVAEREVAQERQCAADAAERQTIAEAALRELEQRSGAAQASSVADYEAKLRRADDDVAAAQRDVVAAKAAQREAERRADATEHECEREMAAKNAAQADVQRLRHEIDRLGAETVPRSAQQRAEELEAALATSKSHAQALQRQLDVATKDLATTQADLQRLRGAVRALKGSNRSMDHELDSVRDIVASSQRDSSVSSVNASSGHIGSALNTSSGLVGSTHRSVSAPASSAAGPVHVPARAVSTDAGPGRMAVRTHSPSTNGTPRHAPAAAPHHHQNPADDPNASIGSVQSRVSFASSVPIPKGNAVDTRPKPLTPHAAPRTPPASARTPPTSRKTTPLAQADTASSSARRRSAQRRTPSPIGSAASSGASSGGRRVKGSADADGRRRVESVLNGFGPALQALRPRQSSRSASADSAVRPTAQSATAVPAAHHHRAQPRRTATPFDQSSSDESSSASSDGLARMVERAWGSARTSR